MTDIVVTIQNDGSDVRTGKICNTLSTELLSVKFLGWQRAPVAHNFRTDGINSELYKHIVRNSRASLYGFFRFYAWLILRINAEKPKIVYCVNEESAFILGPLKNLMKFKLVCDIYDPLADRKSGSRLHKALVFAQWIGRNLSDKLIVTDENRLRKLSERHRRKSVVIQNFPECSTPPSPPVNLTRKQDSYYVAFVGAISERRGVSHLLECLERIPNLEVLCAGWLYDSAAEDFVRNPRVQYFGVISPSASRGIMAFSDVVFCIYDPSVINNVNASPNKIYDAMSVGKPILINRGLVISDFAEREDLGLLYDYNSIESLINAIESLKKRDPSEFLKSKEICYKKFSWESKTDELRGAVIKLLPTRDADDVHP